MKKIKFVVLLFSIVSFGASAQTDYYEVELRDVCDPLNVIVFGDKQPKPKEGIKKIEYHLNKDLKFLTKNPDFSGTVFIECTVNCKGECSNFNAIHSSDNQELDHELQTLLADIKSWNIGEHNGEVADYWYLWKFRVRKGKLTIMDKKKYYK